MAENSKNKKLIVVDISNFIFRAFYAIRPLHAPDGTPVGAVHGVTSMLFKLLIDYSATHLFIAKDAKDSKSSNFRKKIYPDYKANRQETPEDLIPQFDLIGQLLEAMGLPHVEVYSFEADDVIGSAVVQWKDEFDEILIASGDKDLMQFVGGHIKMLDTMKGKIYGRDQVFEKMGVWPEQIVDYLSILGDASDNIPGMKGIGAKGAAKLLNEYQTLDGCIAAKSQLTGKRVIDAFENHLEEALLSKKLIQIKTDLDLGIDAKDTQYSFEVKVRAQRLIAFLEKLDLKQQLKRVQDIVSPAEQTEAETETETEAEVKAEAEALAVIVINVINSDTFNDLEGRLKGGEQAAIHLEFDGGGIFTRLLISASISFDGKTSYYLPFAHSDESLEGRQNLTRAHEDRFLAAAWENPKGQLICQFAKRDLFYGLARGRLFKASFFDITQAHFVLDPQGDHRPDHLVKRYLHHRQFHQLTEFEKEISQLSQLSHFSLKKAAEMIGKLANSLFLLAPILKRELEQFKLLEVYEKIDAPLISVLAHMEFLGIKLNPSFFDELRDDFELQLKEIEEKIHRDIKDLQGDEQGDRINLRSPKQVSEMLFEKLKFPPSKKNKTGLFSTDSDVLEGLDARGLSTIPRMILKYRELDKLLSTYVKVLPTLVSKHSGCLHTNFHQHVAATGRLSSDNPNLQNIPVRTENGRRVRRGFIARPGKLLLSADYSQVELRLLAHFSQDPTMIQAFKEDKDIHVQTAAEVMGLPLDRVGPAERSKAKTVNFGLIYGQSSFGLAKTLRISRQEAREYIITYFERFGRIKNYLDSLKEYCETYGHAKTLFGRKRFLPDIHSKNRTVKASAERIAINSPIQGTAADIIKQAMVDIFRNISAQKLLNSQMILQVHDELIFETDERELGQLKAIVRKGMEDVVQFSIPLKVQMGVGANWFDLK